ncbi:unnamed protein product [Musa textilis]
MCCGQLIGSIEPTCFLNQTKFETRLNFTWVLARVAQCLGLSECRAMPLKCLARRFCELLRPCLARLHKRAPKCLLKTLHVTHIIITLDFSLSIQSWLRFLVSSYGRDEIFMWTGMGLQELHLSWYGL